MKHARKQNRDSEKALGAEYSVRPQAGDDKFPVLEGSYFGQPEPGVQAQPFAPGLISLRGRYEFALSFSPAGESILFAPYDEGMDVCIWSLEVGPGG